MPFGIGTATFNVLVGALIAMFSSAFLNWNQRRVNRDRFRRSLLHEVEHIGTTLEGIVDEGNERCQVDDVEETLVSLSPDVLDADFAQTSKLTSREIEPVYEFYESARIVRRELRRRRDGEERDPTRLYRHAHRTVRLRDDVVDNMKRSRLSRFTEWYKDIDSRFVR